MNPFLPPLLSAALREAHDVVATALFVAAVALIAITLGG